MLQSFLDSLKGLSVSEAELEILERDFEPFIVPKECRAIASIAHPNTVIIWQEKGKVRTAQAGDPTELE